MQVNLRMPLRPAVALGLVGIQVWAMLTLLPIEWTRHGHTGANSPPEAIAYEVAGLAGDRRAVISMAPVGWRLVDERLAEKIDAAARYPTPEEALEVLKVGIEGVGSSAKAVDG